MNNLLESFIYIGSGLLLTLELLIGGMILSVITGTLIAVLRYNHVLPRVWISYISLIRGTPIILQLSFIYFAVPTAFGLRLDIVLAGILTFGLNSSAYISEILRAGIENLPQGQFEAARTLQIPSYYMWKDIILPQVVRNIGPGMVNETISLMKETALPQSED
jgi:polar amino acid transport system permease protein